MFLIVKLLILRVSRLLSKGSKSFDVKQIRFGFAQYIVHVLSSLAFSIDSSIIIHHIVECSNCCYGCFLKHSSSLFRVFFKTPSFSYFSLIFVFTFFPKFIMNITLFPCCFYVILVAGTCLQHS